MYTPGVKPNPRGKERGKKGPPFQETPARRRCKRGSKTKPLKECNPRKPRVQKVKKGKNLKGPNLKRGEG